MPLPNIIIGRLFSMLVHTVGVFVSALRNGGHDGGSAAVMPSPHVPSGSGGAMPERVQPQVRQMTPPAPTLSEMARRETLMGYRPRHHDGRSEEISLD